MAARQVHPSMVPHQVQPQQPQPRQQQQQQHPVVIDVEQVKHVNFTVPLIEQTTSAQVFSKTKLQIRTFLKKSYHY
jgi:hypothetical protein